MMVNHNQCDMEKQKPPVFRKDPMEEINEVERETRGLDQMKGSYRWAMYEDWESLRRYYKENPTKVLDPLTTYKDNALHLVAFAGRMDVLQFLISLIREPRMLRRALTMKNSHGNTTLHEPSTLCY